MRSHLRDSTQACAASRASSVLIQPAISRWRCAGMRSMIAVTLTASSGAPCASSSAQPTRRARRGCPPPNSRARGCSRSIGTFPAASCRRTRRAGRNCARRCRARPRRAGRPGAPCRPIPRPAAGACRRRWRGSARVAADLAVQADGIVLVAHHQEHRVAGAVGQPSQHRQQLAHARVAERVSGSTASWARYFLVPVTGSTRPASAGPPAGGRWWGAGCPSGGRYRSRSGRQGPGPAGRPGRPIRAAMCACGRGIAVLHATL